MVHDAEHRVVTRGDGLDLNLLRGGIGIIEYYLLQWM